jgi:hypothetical protein
MPALIEGTFERRVFFDLSGGKRINHLSLSDRQIFN